MTEKLLLNKQAYNQMAGAYLQDRSRLRSHRYVTRFEEILPRQASILDLGCGAGVPVDDYLIKKGHLVTGLDISETQINMAKQRCKGGAFFVKDIMELKENEYQVDAVVSLYTIFHLPRKMHLDFLEKIASFLPVGGKLLISMGEDNFEAEHDLYGQKVWSSHYDARTNLEMVKNAGFEILLSEIDQSGQEKHLFILAEKT
ncbi:MAG: class I SAM-dependent methyltransferase [Patescibacteria group bacterium]